MILYLGASKHADALFQDVLKRKDDADTMRNALSVLHRFRSLFSLPQIIEKNINQVNNCFKSFINHGILQCITEL
jgi:F0F1-type ATP synthase delta subunit